jgi:hypothetical protein
MKVAICFSGAIRSFDECISSTIKYLIDNFDNPDIFLHMWSFNDYNSTDINYNFKWRKDNSSIDKIISTLEPKKYVIEEYNSSSEEQIKNKCMIDVNLFDTDDKKNYGFNCCSMYWKILKSFELAEEYMKENDFEYDLIIRARLDFIWEDYIKQIDFNTLIDNDIYLIKDRYATCSRLNTNDKFFAGNYPTMKKMCNIFNSLKKYQDEGINIEGQTINETHIKQCYFNVKWIGHSNTYYKFMGRHKILNNKIKILVNLKETFSTNINNEVIYTLIDNGYYVSSNNHIYKYNSCNKNYIPINNTLDEYNYIISNENTSIIIESNFNIKIILKFVSNELINSINDNSCYLTDFILSIVKNFSTLEEKTNEYLFKELDQINKINLKESILYKYSDRGYYLCEYFGLENNCHIIMFNNNKTKVSRNTFKIVKLMNYYRDGFLPINYK